MTNYLEKLEQYRQKIANPNSFESEIPKGALKGIEEMCSKEDLNLEEKMRKNDQKQEAAKEYILSFAPIFGYSAKEISWMLPPGFNPKLIDDFPENSNEGKFELFLALEDVSKKLWIEYGAIEILRKKNTQIRSRPDILPEALIRFFAYQLLKTYVAQNERPHPSLMFLLSELVGASNFAVNMIREPHRWKVAILTKALFPEKGVNELANQLGLNRSTTSRWLNDDEFQLHVANLRKNNHILHDWLFAYGDGFEMPSPYLILEYAAEWDRAMKNVRENKNSNTATNK